MSVFVFLLVGLALGMMTRFALRRRVPVPWAGTILVGIAGAVGGATALSLFRGTAALGSTPASIASAVGGSIAVLAVYAAVASRFAHGSTAPVEDRGRLQARRGRTSRPRASRDRVFRWLVTATCVLMAFLVVLELAQL